ncbi:molybdopterin converting factor subunit 1 [Solemya velesiana gill symbiont]|uniref:Molybdopterin synthase sulfur carrier subunit n=1 Tax=Solemya velesiana gill symbiont TaxID=1918948 RepID=A0A1T2KUI7_9GAMM|nr:molybdopterin converting factor subunit 1 [Solemya velesiana gill symbiont]OOZ36515.1 molybdopterin converting factor subunit 1 [Solemya velesiana gill symbiont]
MIKVLYFARLREQLETASEEMDAAGLENVNGLVTLLKDRGGTWDDVFGGAQPVLMAVNQEMVDGNAAINDGDEVGFFPPVTGG